MCRRRVSWAKTSGNWGHIYTQRRDKGSGTGYGLDCFPTGGQREGRPMLVVGYSTLPAQLFTLVPHIGHSMLPNEYML